MSYEHDLNRRLERAQLTAPYDPRQEENEPNTDEKLERDVHQGTSALPSVDAMSGNVPGLQRKRLASAWPTFGRGYLHCMNRRYVCRREWPASSEHELAVPAPSPIGSARSG